MTQKRSLTFVSPRFLFPTDSGGKIRTTQILRGLQGRAFNVKLLMPSTRRERAQFTEQIQSVCDELVSWEPRQQSKFLRFLGKAISLFGRLPIPVRSDWNAAGAATVKEALDQKPDIVVFDFPHSVVLAPESISVPSVIFTHNVEAEIFQRHWQVARFPVHKFIWHNQFRKMHQFEKKVLSNFDGVIAVSERDCEFFRREYGTSGCSVIPTGVDTEFFGYKPPENRRQVVFCGSMDWMANIDGIEWFFDEVWPRIRQSIPDATMKVVGRTPPDTLVNRICSAAIEWEFTGFVDDVREHICGAAAFVIPLRVGGGTRIKAFEAMAMGTPVVSTSIGIEGLPVNDGEHYLVADSADDFAGQVVALLSDGPQGLRISKAARRLVEDQYGFRRAASVFESICLDTINLSA